MDAGFGRQLAGSVSHVTGFQHPSGGDGEEDRSSNDMQHARHQCNTLPDPPTQYNTGPRAPGETVPFDGQASVQPGRERRLECAA